MNDGPLDHMIKSLTALPGLGSRSAKRLALHLLTNKEKTLTPLIHNLQQAANDIRQCSICGNLDASDPCRICTSAVRDQNVICVVASVADLWAVERTQAFQGQYHVLGGVLSALDGIGPDDLAIDKLVERVKEKNIGEAILALSATVDGQSTAHYVMDRLEPLDVKITRLARGVPVGGELDYLDDGTITTALKFRGN